jgi:hypothetical protein
VTSDFKTTFKFTDPVLPAAPTGKTARSIAVTTINFNKIRFISYPFLNDLVFLLISEQI